MRPTPKVSERQALQKVEQLVARIRRAATRLPEIEKQARIARAANDFMFFGKTYFPHYFTCAPAAMHYEMVESWQVEDDVEVDRLPRGFAKTTFAQMFTAWCGVFSKKHFAVFIGKSQETATESVQAIAVEFEFNERLLQDFGELKTAKWNPETGFVLKTGMGMLPIGRGGVIRGRKLGPHRPDLLIADDLEDEELVRNPKRVRQLLKWWLQAVLPMMGPRGKAIWLGTSLSQKSAIDLLLDPEWSYEAGQPPPRCMRRSYKAENPEGGSTWPELWPDERLAAKRAQIGRTAYNQEYLHIAEMAGGMFRREWFKPYTENDLPREGLVTVGMVDPSVKSKEANDYKALLVISKHLATDRYFIRYAWIQHASAMAMLKKLFGLHSTLQPFVWVFEMQSFADLYKDIINLIWQSFGFYPPIRKIEQSIPKEIRIRQLEPIAENQQIYYMPGHSDQNLLIEQFVYFPSSGMADDGPDAAQMGIDLLKPMRAGTKPMKYERVGAKRDDFSGVL